MIQIDNHLGTFVVSGNLDSQTTWLTHFGPDFGRGPTSRHQLVDPYGYLRLAVVHLTGAPFRPFGSTFDIRSFRKTLFLNRFHKPTGTSLSRLNLRFEEILSLHRIIVFYYPQLEKKTDNVVAKSDIADTCWQRSHEGLVLTWWVSPYLS